MKAITIKQPWVWAIFHARILKPVENRTWGVSYRGPLLIHAGRRPTGKGKDMRYFEESRQFLIDNGQDCPEIDDMVHSAIAGLVELKNVLGWSHATASLPMEARFYVDAGAKAWMLGNQRPFDEPIAYSGERGLFSIPDRVVSDAIRELGLARSERS